MSRRRQPAVQDVGELAYKLPTENGRRSPPPQACFASSEGLSSLPASCQASLGPGGFFSPHSPDETVVTAGSEKIQT